MNNTFTRGIEVLAVIALIAIALLLVGVKSPTPVAAGTPPGVSGTIASSTQEAVLAASATTIAPTSTTCSARVVTTGAAAVMLTFSDFSGQTPSGTYGHYQAASTTVAYDSIQFGCGRMKAIGSTGNTTITVSVVN